MPLKIEQLDTFFEHDFDKDGNRLRIGHYQNEAKFNHQGYWHDCPADVIFRKPYPPRLPLELVVEFCKN